MKRVDVKPAKRIMVRATNWIGDAVMTTPALRAVRETFPEAEIVMVANPLVAQLFDYHPDCDRVIIYDRQGREGGLSGFVRFCARLRRERFDLAILFQNAISAALLAAVGGAAQRLGYVREGRGLFLTHPVAVTAELEQMHHTDYYLHLLAQYGIEARAKVQSLALSDDERQWTEQTLSGGPIAVINPGAAYGSAKRWLPQRFAAVADRIAEKYGMKIILTGGPAESEIGRDIEAAMQHPCRNFIGQTSVRELMALLAGSDLMITNDSGPMHMAAAFNKPIVAIFGPTDHTTTSPWAESTRIVRHAVECSPCLLRQCPIDHRCMERVTVDDVNDAVDDLLAGAA